MSRQGRRGARSHAGRGNGARTKVELEQQTQKGGRGCGGRDQKGVEFLPRRMERSPGYSDDQGGDENPRTYQGKLTRRRHSRTGIISWRSSSPGKKVVFSDKIVANNASGRGKSSECFRKGGRAGALGGSKIGTLACSRGKTESAVFSDLSGKALSVDLLKTKERRKTTSSLTETSGAGNGGAETQSWGSRGDSARRKNSENCELALLQIKKRLKTAAFREKNERITPFDIKEMGLDTAEGEECSRQNRI